MLLRILLALLGSEPKKTVTPPGKTARSELSREKDRREYEMWVMAEEYEEDGD